MLVELLEKFEDVFKPLGKEEVKRRAPYWEVRLYNTSKSRGPDAMLAKTFKVKGNSRYSIYNNLLKGLGMQGVQSMVLHTKKIYIIPGNNVKDNDGALMMGWYTVEMVAEDD